jgi:putative (di)nucleoside polyphosphate hydrolase
MKDTSHITEYRPCVGIMLFNKQGQVWIGRRFEKQSDEGNNCWWQMPQGGIDEGEDASLAALRELQEETAITSARILGEAPGWFKYDLPKNLIGKSWKGKYRGQKQKWFAMEFLGDDSEVNLSPPGHKQEFDQWRWAKLDEMLELIVPFKREVYVDVIATFRHFGA